MSSPVVVPPRQQLPFLGLLLYLGLDFLRPHDVFVELRAYRPMLVLAAATVALTIWQRRRHLLDELPLLAPLLALAAAAALSTFGSMDPGVSLFALVEVGKMLVLVWLLVVLVGTERRLIAVLWVIAVALSVLAVAAIVQGLDRGLMHEFSVNRVIQGPQGNHDGPFRDNNNLARVFAVAVPLWWLLATINPTPGLRILACAGLLLTVVAIEFTFSRSGFVALMAGTAIVALSYRPPWRGVAIWLSFVIALLVLSPSPYLRRIGGLSAPLAEGSMQHRLRIWEAAINRVRQHPFTGQGLGTFESVKNDPTAPVPLSSHNIFIEVLFEMGLIGLAAYLWVLAATLHGLHAMRRTDEGEPDRRLRAASFGLEGALIAYLAASLALSSPFQSPLFVLIGLALAGRRLQPRERMPRGS